VTSRCAAADRCSAFDRREGVPEPLTDHPVLGEACLSAGERAVRLLPLAYVDLGEHLAPSSGRGDGQPGGSAELRVPMNLGVEALQRRIHAVLTTWEEIVRDYAQLSDAPRLARDGAAVQRAAMILGTRVRLLAQVPPVTLLGYPYMDEEQTHRLGAIEYAELPGWRGVTDFARLHRQALAAQGLTDAVRESCKGVPCKRCDYMTLFREHGEDWVTCTTCGLWYSARDYLGWVKLLSAAVKQEV
jgi:hypothetical protein